MAETPTTPTTPTTPATPATPENCFAPVILRPLTGDELSAAAEWVKGLHQGGNTSETRDYEPDGNPLFDTSAPILATEP